MPRIALGLEYDGSAYRGWQTQAHAVAVQSELEAALAEIAGHPVRVTAAGRTDAGVHACSQVVHFDTEAERPDRAWVRGVNTHLPADIGVRWVAHPGKRFDARRSGVARRYRYLLQSSALAPVLMRNRVGWTWKALDLEPMRAAVGCLLGEHDFSSFRAAGCQARHPVRTVTEVSLERRGSLIALEIEANAFLHHMVRNVVGSLMVIGSGERPSGWLADVLQARDRRVAGVTAPAAGLYLLGVRYPAPFDLPGPATTPAFASIPTGE
ncbi:tRNA pseudouridine(38-40) synthase TruA [Spiribacter salinus]|uniref:tRNA pseudouridine(38-40) synthase TruA n=1 Tax=Spiribacter salinus TaxID=1335746 RepID=UPI001C97361C|nr:tRNA pseudouridine(38-40) synthase TruA [Spiribacter salinus]MBY5268977.1 tRNA pseudouridine(38,39,40) synthase TruA [Spiribacter salinus]